MSDRVAIVTGGGQGIGKAIARRFLAQGMACAIADCDEEAGRETEAELAPAGRAVFIPADVADELQVRALVQQTVERFGGLDILVNNAAISRGGPASELPREAWDRVLAVNLTGPFLCSRHAAPHLRARRGAIVNIASTRAFMSEPNTEAYAASKGGLVALTHALAISLGPEVRVNCVSPGWIDTTAWKKRSARQPVHLSDRDHRQHPAGRVGCPDDIAALVLYLTGPESGFLTGVNVMADGGMTRKMIYEP